MKLIRLAAVFIIIVIIPLGAAANPGTPAPPNAAIRGTEQKPLIIQVIPTADELRHEAEQRSDRALGLATSKRALAEQEQSDRTERAIGFATILILVVQFLAFLYQGWQMRESVVAMKKATTVAEEAADKAKKSADAAVAANDLNRAALIADQRPWLAIHGNPLLTFTRGPDAKWKLNIRFDLKNTGKTPAHNIRIFGQLLNYSADDEDLERAHLSFCETQGQAIPNSTTAICFPGDTIALEGDVQLSDGFQSTPILDVFALSGFVSYTFNEDQSRHNTLFLYRIQTRNADSINGVWRNASNTRLNSTNFVPAPVSCGWRAT